MSLLLLFTPLLAVADDLPCAKNIKMAQAYYAAEPDGKGAFWMEIHFNEAGKDNITKEIDPKCHSTSINVIVSDYRLTYATKLWTRPEMIEMQVSETDEEKVQGLSNKIGTGSKDCRITIKCIGAAGS